MIAEALTYVADVRTRMLAQYREMPMLRGLIESFAAQLQGVESAAWDVLQQSSLGDVAGTGTITTPRATGIWLQRLADIVGADLSTFAGLPSNPTNDAARARFIFARVLANRSSGTIEEIIRIALMAADGEIGSLTEYFPAAVVIEFLDEGGQPTRVARLLAELRRARAAAIGLFVLGSVEPYSDTFTFSDTGSEVADVARGWGDDYNDPAGTSIGGVFSFAEQA